MGMGKKLDAFLGKSFKTSKFRATVALAISRLAVLKNQRQARCSIARSDVVEFLKTSNHERAILRVDQVIKEQNMLDVFVVLEGYCHLLMERVNLFEQEKVCPEELKEAVSTLIFASTRCGEFPELQEIRAIFTSRFGKEFVARAAELRNNCGVNPKIIQKLSTRMPTLENKMKLLKEIASENNVDFHIEETVTETTPENKDSGLEKQQKLSPSSSIHPDETGRSGVRRKYRDVADAAQAAFESAAYAADAARAAVELSRSESTDPDHPNSPNFRPREVSPTIEPVKDSLESDRMKTEMKYDKIHQNEDFKSSFSASSSDTLDDNVKGARTSSDDQEGRIKQRDVVFDESDGEDDQQSWNQENGAKMEQGPGNNPAEFTVEKRSVSIEPLNINRRPMSVRSRWAR